MGTIARYLIPIDSKLSAAEYATKAKTVLLQMVVISYPDGDKKVFYNGERSTEPFQVEPDDGECGFDLGGIFAGPGFVIAPEEYVDEATCPRCNADLTGLSMSQVRNDDGDPIQHPSKDARI